MSEDLLAYAGYDRRVFRIDGIDGESIVVDGIWVEKLRTNTSLDALVAELEKAWDRASS